MNVSLIVSDVEVAIKVTRKQEKTKDFVLFAQEKECKAMFKVREHPNVVSLTRAHILN